MEHIYLMGSEDVRRAAAEMQAAAAQMNQAASNFGFQVDRLERLWSEVAAHTPGGPE